MTDLIRIPYVSPPTIGPDEDPTMWARRLTQYLERTLKDLHDLTGGSIRWQNLRSQLILGQVVAAGAPPVVTAGVVHTLDKVPEFIFFMDKTAGAPSLQFKVTAIDQGLWTNRIFQFTETTGVGGLVDLLVI